MKNPEFWAKTTSTGEPGISVYEHMLNVGYVARCFAEYAPKLMERFRLRADEVAAIASLHDLGKISPGFQRKCEPWLAKHGLETVARNGVWDTNTESDHGKVTHAAVQPFLVEKGMPRKVARFVAAILGAHHGKIKNHPDERGWRLCGISESSSGIPWDSARNETASKVVEVFGPDFNQVSVGETSPSLWWLAGLTTIADWIGSDERFFAAEGGLPDTSRPIQAEKALGDIGFGAPKVTCGLPFVELFGFPTNARPNDMQVRAVEAIQGPGVYVIEAPMGTGKTEAALWAAYKLLEQARVVGIYFALPTQATSNRIHLRMTEFVNRIAPGATRSRLIHGNSWLIDDSLAYRPSSSGSLASEGDARTGRDWFTSAKRALLAPFGVGTVDQALLGIVAAKHFFVRHFALAGKVVILDEVHSYDLYTGTLIDKLVKTLEGLGCVVIILSATLTGKRREQLVSSRAADDSAELAYPLITGSAEHESDICVAAAAPDAREVKIEFGSYGAFENEAVILARRSGVVLWICNTVAAAQSAYGRLAASSGGTFKVGLLHSRFTFWRREELENEWMERLGKSGNGRCGCILVSTQVVEQSVDLDADLLITELAPTDMLLQRMGRLWRHSRPNRMAPNARMCILDESKSLDDFRQMKPKDIQAELGSKAYVYWPYVLLRSLQVWKARIAVTIPGEIRSLIESTYSELEDEPDGWRKLFDEHFATDLAKKFRAARSTNLWQAALEDEEGVQTRLNDVPDVALVLCKRLDSRRAIFLDGSDESVAKDDFRLRTAQAIHRNLVRVPKYRFEQVRECKSFGEYLHGDQALGIVTDDGIVQTDGLADGIQLQWDIDLGLVVKDSSARSDI